MRNNFYASAGLATTLVLLGGCATSRGSGQNGIDPLLARGEQPAWQLTVTPARIVFAGNNNALLVDEPNASGQVPKAGRIAAGRILVDTAVQPCTLATGTFSQTVRVTVDGQQFSGCGGEQARGLTLGGGSWTVLSVNGRPTPLDRPFEARFEAGRLSLQLGCNRMTAPYTLAGRVLSVGAVAKTRMACPNMSFEEGAEKVLAVPFNVEAIGGEQVVLRNPLGSLNLARSRS